MIKTKSRSTIQSLDAPFQDDNNCGTAKLPHMEDFEVALRDFTQSSEELYHDTSSIRVASYNDHDDEAENEDEVTCSEESETDEDSSL